MRISDWSSDVCSSDLPRHPDLLGRDQLDRRNRGNGLMTGAYGEAYDDAYDTLSAGSGGVGGWNGLLGILRSEEHTSELQSLMRISYAVFCLKKKNIYKQPICSNIELQTQ